MSFEDLRLDHAEAQSAAGPPDRRPVGRWIIVALVAIAAGAALTFWWMSRAQPTPAPAPSTAAADVAAESNRPMRQPMDLPPLGASDSFLRTLVSSLSQHPTLARWLTTDGLARGATLAVVQIGDGRTPADPLRALRPSSRTQIVGSGPSGRIDPQSYRRWDGAVAALTSISPTDAAQLYVNVKPLLDEAYLELGHGNEFDNAITRAITLLRETPVPATSPTLLRRAGYFEHEDAKLRALRPVQKQFLLIGPDNQRRVLAWLDAFTRALDLDAR